MSDRARVESYLWAVCNSSDAVVCKYFGIYDDVDIAEHLLLNWPDESVSADDLIGIIADIRAEMLEE